MKKSGVDLSSKTEWDLCRTRGCEPLKLLVPLVTVVREDGSTQHVSTEFICILAKACNRLWFEAESYPTGPFWTWILSFFKVWSRSVQLIICLNDLVVRSGVD